MSSRIHHAVLVGVPDRHTDHLTPVLERTGYRVEHAATAVEALDHLWNTPCDLVIVHHPVPGIALDDLLATIRDKASPSRSCGLLLVVPDGELEDAERRLGRGVSRVVARGSEPDHLLCAIGDLVAPSPRLPVRAMVVLAYRRSEETARGLLRTRDISRTGMLMEGGLELPVDAVFGFQLHLPGAPTAVQGRARVVRHTDPRRERTHGVGATFLPLAGDDRSSLDDFLDHAARPLRA